MRLRITNAKAATIFDVALAGHDLRVTHTDGYPVQPRDTPSLRIGMGERYDAIITLGDGVFPLVAAAAGTTGLARAVARTGQGAVPPQAYRPGGLDQPALTADQLRAALEVALPNHSPDSEQDLLLGGSMRG